MGNPQITNWKVLNEETSNDISEIKNGEFCEINIIDNKFDFGQIQNIKTIYISAYPESVTINENELSATGEIVTKREYPFVDKYDLYLLGITEDSKIVYTGPFKKIPEHHVKSKERVKIESLFGKFNKKNLSSGYNRVKN